MNRLVKNGYYTNEATYLEGKIMVQVLSIIKQAVEEESDVADVMLIAKNAVEKACKELMVHIGTKSMRN